MGYPSVWEAEINLVATVIFLYSRSAFGHAWCLLAAKGLDVSDVRFSVVGREDQKAAYPFNLYTEYPFVSAA